MIEWINRIFDFTMPPVTKLIFFYILRASPENVLYANLSYIKCINILLGTGSLVNSHIYDDIEAHPIIYFLLKITMRTDNRKVGHSNSTFIVMFYWKVILMLIMQVSIIWIILFWYYFTIRYVLWYSFSGYLVVKPTKI